ncbi:phenylalanyl-tRNA synthetase subunit alpha [Candidatus Acidianus copahuensis]|uniref:Phenylalanine--tRNA ligase alpha subunit n=1 Tax=Candidatus Acidianus copahuensis TaxID=1160895 RepID=A0A031LLT9_9CREN|nr:phenylalanine--tRNA ligase subunit alpha [Candidatus Acidianus copahuensis]EZQ03182.1 phenylalanyl-tRNA synthetase subunit alpha [Candidatus Acidianus copahuensis]
MISENEAKILGLLSSKKVLKASEISEYLGIPLSSVFSLANLLKEKGYVSIKEEENKLLELTDEGKLRLKNGLPEDVLISKLNGSSVKISEAKEILGKDFNIALSWAKRKNLVQISNDMIIPKYTSYTSPEFEYLRKVSLGEKIDTVITKELERRGLVREIRSKDMEISLIKDVDVRQSITFLTPELIASGDWKNYTLKEYNVAAFPPFIQLGKLHFFREFLERVKDAMVSLGFEEVRGNFVEMEFYNFDMLFQAQDHPAREIHDSFQVEGKGKLPKDELVKNVREVHEKWWRYEWNQDISKRLVLRSQTTAVTARQLTIRRGETKVFTIGKVFRPDAIDATHLIEFHQLDGLIIEKDFSFVDLLSILKEIFFRIGIKEVKFKPGYFPFTEPSVEIYGYINGLGWVEMAGSGLLRPEVTEPAGVNMPAGAWGLGLDRLAMLMMSVNDIRNLYSDDIEYLRERRIDLW